MDAWDKAQAVESRRDLAQFLADLCAEVREGRVATDNASAPDILDGASAWLVDMDGYFLNRGEEVPTSPSWKLLAMIFAASLAYE
jgi:hypothetical protein